MLKLANTGSDLHGPHPNTFDSVTPYGFLCNGFRFKLYSLKTVIDRTVCLSIAHGISIVACKVYLIRPY